MSAETPAVPTTPAAPTTPKAEKPKEAAKAPVEHAIFHTPEAEVVSEVAILQQTLFLCLLKLGNAAADLFQIFSADQRLVRKIAIAGHPS